MDHKDNMTHHFMTRIKVKNRHDEDIISITHPEDEDKKIVWNYVEE